MRVQIPPTVAFRIKQMARPFPYGHCQRDESVLIGRQDVDLGGKREWHGGGGVSAWLVGRGKGLGHSSPEHPLLVTR